MTLTVPVKAVVYEGSTPVLMARIVGVDNVVTVAADLNNVDYRVDLAGVQVITTTAITPIATYVTALVTTDAAWDKDATGYNFRYRLAAADIPLGGSVYYVQFRFKDTSNRPSYLTFDLTTTEQYFD